MHVLYGSCALATHVHLSKVTCINTSHHVHLTPIRPTSSPHHHMLRGKRSITEQRRPRLKPQRARQIIRRFHVLQKNKAAILKRLSLTDGHYTGKVGKEYQNGVEIGRKNHNADPDRPEKLLPSELELWLGRIDGELTARGGLHVYQMALTVGQAGTRGGDSLKKLVEWMRELKWRMDLALEIGSLLSENAILTSGVFRNVLRIDLKSQDPGVREQDFFTMETTDKFNLISCLLVLNFVPDAKKRGLMLRKMVSYLSEIAETGPKPSIFLVLPLPCTANSRYFTKEMLQNIMAWLGLELLKYHQSHKVSYWLFSRVSKRPLEGARDPAKIKKTELAKGDKNNFYVDMSR